MVNGNVRLECLRYTHLNSSSDDLVWVGNSQGKEFAGSRS